VFPQPLPWIGCHPRPEMISSAITALYKKRSNPESFPPAPRKPPLRGNCGWVSAQHTTSIHGSQMSQTPSHTSRYSDNVTGKADSRPATTPSELTQLLTPCEWWDRPTSNWGPGTSDSTDSRDNSISVSSDN
jgi:hypothetical protein